MEKLNKRLREIYIKEILMVAAIIVAVWVLQPNFEIVINRSQSLPINFVLIKKGELPTKKDSIFVFKVRNNPHYKMKETNFIKLLGGTSGEKIIVNDRNIFVEGRLIGAAKTNTLKGQSLTMAESGIIPPHKFFAYTTHKDSFDSRYKDLGLIDEKDIIGTAIFAF